MTEKTEDQDKTIPFYPDHIGTEIRVMWGMLVLAIIVGVLGAFFPIGLEPPADPMNTPAHVKPEWYFLALYQILKYIPKTVGVMLPMVGLLVAMVFPFFDKSEDTKKKTRIRFIASISATIIFIALTIWGQVS